jgi:hypothetical protein
MALRGLLSPAEELFAQAEVIVFRPPTTPVPGALTQDVDPATTDSMAAQMAPQSPEEQARTQAGSVSAADADGQGDEGGEDGNADDARAGGGASPASYERRER